MSDYPNIGQANKNPYQSENLDSNNSENSGVII